MEREQTTGIYVGQAFQQRKRQAQALKKCMPGLSKAQQGGEVQPLPSSGLEVTYRKSLKATAWMECFIGQGHCQDISDNSKS